MEKERAIELLIQAVDEIPHLKTLHYQNDEIKLWLDKVGNILRAGLKPEDYSKYWPVSQVLEILKGVYEDNIYQEGYLKKVTNYEIALKSILLKYEVVGMEGKRDKGGEVEMVRRGKMDEKQRQQIINELKDFYKKLKSYNRYVCAEEQLSQVQIRYRDSLREKLVRQSGALKGKIIELTGTQYAEGPLTGRFDIWAEAFNTIAMSADRTALAFCINAVNEAIGKLESDIKLGVRDRQGNVIGEPLKDIAELPIHLFDKMQFHPRIRRVSKSLFNSGYYAESIFAAFKTVNNFIKRKAGLQLDGKDLMAKVFSEDKPIIKLNKLSTKSELNEQEGFRFLYMGAMVGIRNPKAHEDIRQIDPYKALEYLSFASLLMRRATEGKLEIENK